MIHLDGSRGEGGGQILRTALTCALVTGRAVTLSRVRAGRKKPGLLRQHLACVRAAARVGSARVTGDELGSTELVFEPGVVSAGVYEIEIGSAGASTLVLQTVLPALLRADGPSRITVRGGTHNPLAPPFEALALAWGRALRAMGGELSFRLARHGFHPAGGGEIVVDVAPSTLRPVVFTDRGRRVSWRASAVTTTALGPGIAAREAAVLVDGLGLSRREVVTEVVEADGPGNVAFAVVEHEHVTDVFSALGKLGVPAEHVAGDVVAQVRAYDEAGAAVGEHLADQLLLPMVLAGGGSFTTTKPSLHTTTQIGTLAAFFDVPIAVVEESPGVFRATVGAG